MTLRLFPPVSTRRQFLTTSATTLIGLSAAGRVASAMAETRRVIPFTAAARQTTPGSWLPDPPPAEQFRALALVAMDTANQSGADFADIRIGVQRFFNPPSTSIAVGYGIRARVGGTWSFQHGMILTPDAIAAATRSAVAGARAAATINTRLGRTPPFELAPAPVVTGEWRSPVEIDPFMVPMDDYFRLLVSVAEIGKRFGRLVQSSASANWQVETRVFASTDGSLVTQELTRCNMQCAVSTTLPDNPGDSIVLPVPGFESRSAGFEALLRTDFAERIEPVVDQAIRWRALPIRPFQDVGRFPVVCDGATMAAMIGQTVSLALDGDRVAGFEADASGSSFLTPVTDVLGAIPSIFSPLLTVTSDRALPSRMAVQWDDEGVSPEPYALIERGRVVDYHTTRETAPLLSEWYRQHGRPLRAHGGAIALTPASLPTGSSGELHVAPSANRTNVDDLFHDMDHGFLVLQGRVTASPGLTNGFLFAPVVVEIKRGTPVSRLGGRPWIAFGTKTVMNKSLTALGDATTLGTHEAATQKGLPWQEIRTPVTAPAASFKEMDLVGMTLNR